MLDGLAVGFESSDVKRTRRIALVALAVLVATGASAQPTTVFIPGRSWVLTFDIGLVTQYQARSSGQHMAFWTKAKSNPLIDGASVKHTSDEAYEQVLYRLQNGQQHANFYFVKDGLCADIHISLSKPMPLSEEAMSGFGRRLKW